MSEGRVGRGERALTKGACYCGPKSLACGAQTRTASEVDSSSLAATRERTSEVETSVLARSCRLLRRSSTLAGVAGGGWDPSQWRADRQAEAATGGVCHSARAGAVAVCTRAAARRQHNERTQGHQRAGRVAGRVQDGGHRAAEELDGLEAVLAGRHGGVAGATSDTGCPSCSPLTPAGEPRGTHDACRRAAPATRFAGAASLC